MHKLSKLDLENLEKRQRANIVNSLSGYKSPFLIGSKNPQTNTENLAIFSNVFHVGSSPALLGVFFRPAPQGVRRHTLENIKDSKFFTLNFINSEMIEQAHQTSARYDENQSEFEQTQITTEYHDDFQAPFAKQSPLKLSMKLEEQVHITNNQTSIIIASIQGIYSQSTLITNEICELERHSPIATKGLDTYLSVDKISRLSYAKVGTTPNKI